MADLKTLMEDIARAIRLKTGVSDKINAQDFPQKIREIGNNGNTSVSLNIAYGDTEPDDTSKLWIKADEPESIVFGSNFEGIENIETVSNIPDACYYMSCARVEDKVYLFGGYNGSYLDTINVFDIKTRTIVTLNTTLPVACRSMGCISIGTKVYLFGGYDGSNYLNTINVFDTETETITTLENVVLPTACYYMACAKVENKIYLLGGIASGTRNYLKTINIFDTDTETIIQLTTKLPFSGYGMGCASVGKLIYLFGYYYYSMGAVYSNSIYLFDTETQTIIQSSVKLPAACCDIGCANVGDNIYLFGGRAKNNLNTINVFNTTTETIKTLNTILPAYCYGMGCISYGNIIYLFGGYSSGGYLNTINQFSLAHELTQNNIEVITDYKNFFNIIDTEIMKIEIGVNSVLIGNAENQAENCEAYLHQNDTWIQI